jgi:HEAT repeat protein
MAFDDPRVLDFVCEEFTGATHAPVILAMAARLAELPVDERREVLEPVLLDPKRPTHVRAAANLLADCVDLARRAILARLERSLSDGHAELLAQALHDPDWRVRSAAGRMLVSLGDVALEPLRNVFLDDDEAARAAAGRALMELGEQQWIEANLPD